MSATYLPLSPAKHRCLLPRRPKRLQAVRFPAWVPESAAVFWLVFLGRHASTGQKVAFFALGAPYLAVRAAARELRSGNPGAIRGWLRGLLRLLRGG